MTKKIEKFFIVHFPIIIVAIQLLVTVIGSAFPEWYNKYYLWLGAIAGMNVLFSFFMVAFCDYVKSCKISKWCAWAELLCCLLYLLIPNEVLYNTIIQIVLFSVALIITGFIFKQEKQKEWIKEQS